MRPLVGLSSGALIFTKNKGIVMAYLLMDRGVAFFAIYLPIYPVLQEGKMGATFAVLID